MGRPYRFVLQLFKNSQSALVEAFGVLHDEVVIAAGDLIGAPVVGSDFGIIYLLAPAVEDRDVFEVVVTIVGREFGEDEAVVLTVTIGCDHVREFREGRRAIVLDSHLHGGGVSSGRAALVLGHKVDHEGLFGLAVEHGAFGVPGIR